MPIMHNACACVVSFPDPAINEERVWYTSSAFWGAQDVASYVIFMTGHHLDMATNQPLSCTAYSGCHMIITCKPVVKWTLTLSRATSQFCTTRDLIEWARSQFCTISKSRRSSTRSSGSAWLGENTRDIRSRLVLS